MTGLNLHRIVRSAITSVKPDELVLLYRSVGQINVDGMLNATYEPGIAIYAQFQPNEASRLLQAEQVSSTTITEQVFLYSDTTRAVASLDRLPLARTGDIIDRNGQWWLVTAIMEDFSTVGWANVEVTKQVTAPDFSASAWSDSNG